MALHYRHFRQITFCSDALQDALDPQHKLFGLAEKIDWGAIHDQLRPYYSKLGRRALPIRLMVGLHLLKHMENLSDAQCADRVRGDLYWMEFCGVDAESLKGKYSHLDCSSMTKFRNRIGEAGFSALEAVIRQYLLDTGYIHKKGMTTDSSCLEKHVAYPTDSSLLDKGRKNLLKGIKRLESLGVKGVKGLRSFSRRSKRIILDIAKLGKDRAERIEAGTKELARQAVHVAGQCEKMLRKSQRFLREQSDLEGKVRRGLEQTRAHLREQKALLKRVIEQARKRYQGIHVSNKVYSLHEPDITVIRKGKRSRQNEYGAKFNLSIDKRGFIVSHELYWENTSDAKLLKPGVENWEKSTGQLPKQVNGDRGYNQTREEEEAFAEKGIRLCIAKKGKGKHPCHKKRWFREGQRVRAAIEPVISHLKADHGLERCRYRGKTGDWICLALGSMAWNLNKLARQLT